MIDLLQPFASDKGVDLGVETPQGDVFVCADCDKLHQILLNLIHNAIKFTPPGGRVCVVASSRGDGTVMTTVRDTGEGIRPEELPLVFEKFCSGRGLGDPEEGERPGVDHHPEACGTARWDDLGRESARQGGRILLHPPGRGA